MLILVIIFKNEKYRNRTKALFKGLKVKLEGIKAKA